MQLSVEAYERPKHIKVGPARDGLEATVSPTDGSTPARVVLDGARAYARFLMARQLAGAKYDAIARASLNRLDEAIEKPWVAGEQDFLTWFRRSGLTLQYDEMTTRLLAEQHRRETARYSRWLPEPQDDGTTNWSFQPGTVAQADMNRVRGALDDLGWLDHLFPYAVDSIVEAGTKRDVLAALSMGLGKTRLALALTEVYRYMEDLHQTPTVILGLRRHLTPWVDEFAKIPLLRQTYGQRPYEVLIDKKDKPTYSAPFMLVSLERLVRLEGEEQARLIQAFKTSSGILDEGYIVSNKNTQRTQALFGLSGAHHVTLTGSPIRGYPDSILAVLQWTFRGGSSMFPDYPVRREGSERKFASEFVTYAVAEDGSRKKVPYLKNARKFYEMISPLMIRRLRGEPDVVAVLGDVLLEEEHVDVQLDELHMAHYNAILKRFTEWYIRELEARGTPNAFPPSELLVKLGFLVRGVAAPWRMADHSGAMGESGDEEFDWQAYPRQPTAVHEYAMTRAAQEVEAGRQVIIFGATRDPLDLMAETLNARGVVAAAIHGGLHNDERVRLFRAFRAGDIAVLCGSYGTLAEAIDGLQVASRVILTEYDWSPSTVKQAIGRITRPGVPEKPIAVYVGAPGTIQDYVRRLSSLKQSGMDAGLDNVTQSDDDAIPDIQAYAASLVGVGAPDEAPSRSFELEVET